MLGLLLVLAVVGVGQTTVRVTGIVCRLELDLGARVPIRCVPEPNVEVRFINASNAALEATVFTDSQGRFDTRVRRGIHGYALLQKADFKITATFLVYFGGDITGIRLPIVSNTLYDTLIAIAAFMCNVQQLPNKSIIFTLFHPEGRLPDGTPESVYRGAAVDSASYFDPLNNQIPIPPPGDRRWLGLLHGQPRCTAN